MGGGFLMARNLRLAMVVGFILLLGVFILMALLLPLTDVASIDGLPEKILRQRKVTGESENENYLKNFYKKIVPFT